MAQQEETIGHKAINLHKSKTVQQAREYMFTVDEKDKQAWHIITDVPKMPSPWQYVCFILNVIIPGTHY